MDEKKSPRQRNSTGAKHGPGHGMKCITDRVAATHLLGLGLIRGRVPFLDLLGRMRDLPGRLSELLLCARLRHRDVGREWLLVGGNWRAVGDVE